MAAATVLAVGVTACGGAGHASNLTTPLVRLGSARTVAPRAEHRTADPVALVTAETRNQLVAVDLRTGTIRRRIAVPADPEDIAVGGNAIVVSPATHAVTILDPHTLRVIARLRDFQSPHITAIAPDGEYAYVTDDGAGTVTPIRLSDDKQLPSVQVGAGAHHMSFSPSERRLWIALGESARTIVILDTTDPSHPRLVRRFDPGFAAHDLSFSPDGRAVWVTSATGPDVTAFDARTLRPRFRVPVGGPPQHLTFDRAAAYLTSGYGRTIERVDAATGRMVARARSPYGSFELDAAGGYVATSSLLRGTLAIYDTNLRLRRTVQLAPATREVAIVG